MSIELTGNMVVPGNDVVRPEAVAVFRDAKQGDAAFDKVLEKAGDKMEAGKREPGVTKRADHAAHGETGRRAEVAENKAGVTNAESTPTAEDGIPAVAGEGPEAEGPGSSREQELLLQEAMKKLLEGKNRKMKKDGVADPKGLDGLKGTAASKGIAFSGMTHGLKGNNELSLKGRDKEGHSLISDKLRDVAMLNGKTPEEVEVDAQGAMVLAGILKELGVGEDQIKELLSGMKEKTGGKPFSLSELIAMAEDLEFKPDVADEGKEALEITALPFIESLLTLMGIKPADMENVLKEAVTDGEKIDLEKLVTALKDLQAVTGRREPLQPGGAQAAQAGKLMAGIGFGMEVKVPLTVGEFASRLETMTVGNAAYQGGNVRNSADMPNNPMGKSRGEKFAGKVEKSDRAVAPGTNGMTAATMETNPASFGKPGVPAGEIAKTAVSVAAGNQLPGASELKPGASTEMSLSREMGDEVRVVATPGATHDIHGREIPIASRGQERMLPTYVAEQVGRQIYRAVRNGENEIRFQINPATLGRIRLSMEKTSEGVKVVIFAEQNTTRDMLMAGTNDMKTLLSEQGIKVDRIDVDLSGNFGDTLAGAKQGSDDSGSRGSNSGGGKAGGNDRNGEHVTGDTSAMGSGRENGILDLVA